MPLRRAKFAAALALTLAYAAAAAVAGCERATPEDIARADAPIIGGKLDTTHKGVVSLLKSVQTPRGEGFYPACSGTLIAPNLVLTAHHCVASLNSADGASVECGTTEFSDTDKPSDIIVSAEANVGEEGLDPYRVAQVWVPPGGNAVCGRDVALLLLAGGGVPATIAAPIEPALDQDLAAHEVFAAVGYGLQDPSDQAGDTAGHRMWVTNAEVFCDGSACGSDMVTDGEFIADSPICSGDSGGPALNSSGRVSGVTSRGDAKCTVGIYSSVYAWRDFIIEKTFDAANAGNYAPPAWAFGPLGTSCSDQCPDSYKCWAETGQPPGICVPECSAASPMCPSGYSCDKSLGACTKPGSASSSESRGCSVAAPTSPVGGAAWLGLGLLGLASVRRRVRRA